MKVSSFNRSLAQINFLSCGPKRFLRHSLSFFVPLSILSLLLSLQTAFAAPPQLKIKGAYITNASSGCTVRLRGVDIDGLQYGVDNAATGGITATAAYAISNWKCNVIRLPLNQDRWFLYPVSYRDMVDQVIKVCSQNNCYVILDLHFSGTSSSATTPPYGAGWGTATAQQPMADMNAVTFWSSVASRYANNTAVMFDLYNEPYSISNSIWYSGGSTGSFNTPGMNTLLNTVRGAPANANNIVIAGGLSYCNDLATILNNGYGLTDTGSGWGILYDSHIYSNNGNQTVNVSLTTYPVFVGEFGPCATCGNDGGAFDNTFIPYLNTNNLSWTAWTMDIPPDDPSLINDWTYATTSFHGAPVVSSLTGTANPACDTALGGPTYTPTPVPTQGGCFMLTNFTTAATYPYANATNTLNGGWSAYDWTSLGSGSPVTPALSYVSCPATNMYCPAILNNSIAGPNGETYSAFVSGGYSSNGATVNGNVEYAGFGLQTDTTVGYTNLSWVTNFSFYIRSSVAPVTLRFQMNSPQINQEPITWQGQSLTCGGKWKPIWFQFCYIPGQYMDSLFHAHGGDGVPRLVRRIG